MDDNVFKILFGKRGPKIKCPHQILLNESGKITTIRNMFTKKYIIISPEKRITLYNENGNIFLMENPNFDDLKYIQDHFDVDIIKPSEEEKMVDELNIYEYDIEYNNGDEFKTVTVYGTEEMLIKRFFLSFVKLELQKK